MVVNEEQAVQVLQAVVNTALANGVFENTDQAASAINALNRIRHVVNDYTKLKQTPNIEDAKPVEKSKK